MTIYLSQKEREMLAAVSRLQPVNSMGLRIKNQKEMQILLSLESKGLIVPAEAEKEPFNKKWRLAG